MAAPSRTLEALSEEHPLADLYDYARPRRAEPSRSRKRPRSKRARWQPLVVSNFPDRIPVTSAEVDIFEAHFADFFEELFGPKA